ncbi:MAG: phosphatase PAP2 family protein [Coriobacteriia bacterium]|nr:phosphatase PAP2 family protein [Coriobacteriia bacterium]
MIGGAGRRGIVVAATMAAAAALATEVASRYIITRFPERPTAPDLAYEVLPHIPEGSYVTLVAMAAIIVLYMASVIRHDPGRIPAHITAIALVYLFRAAMTVLTPLAHARDGSLVPFPLFTNGLFPSGHTALALLLLLFIGRKKAPRLHAVGVALFFVMAVSMLFSRGHYSIDIVGGALLGYFVWREWSEGSMFEPLRRLVSPQG